MEGRPANPEEVAVLDTPDRIWDYWEAHHQFEVGFEVIRSDVVHGLDDEDLPRTGVIKGFEGGAASVLWKGDDEPVLVGLRVLVRPPGRYQVLDEEGGGSSSPASVL